jgi:hypothetical protein
MRQFVIPGIIAAVFLITGCGTGSNAPAPVVNPPSVVSQVQEIQNNPNMPPQAKAAALGAIQARSMPSAPKPTVN